MKEITLIKAPEEQIMMISDILFSNNNSDYIIKLFENFYRYSLNPTLNKHIQRITSNKGLNEYNNLLIGLPKPKDKKSVFNTYKLNIEKFINLIHSSAEISQYATLGKGVRIEPLVTVAGKTNIGNLVTIGRNTSVGHHCNIGDYSSLNPSCKIAGYVNIGERTEIGIGATVIHDINIGSNTLIGAGSVVTKHIPDNVIAYGVPCKVIRKNN